jgi:outer membrane receptor for ferrienterochelin and colicin
MTFLTNHPNAATRALLPVVVLSLIAAACASRNSSEPANERAAPAAREARENGLAPGGIVLTQDDIRAMGVRDAFHAVEKAASHLRIQRTRNGSPEKITQRGVTSFLLSSEILVVVDGTRVQTVVQHLQNIPAESILFIQILTANEASARYGSEAGNGVITLRTAALR